MDTELLGLDVLFTRTLVTNEHTVIVEGIDFYKEKAFPYELFIGDSDKLFDAIADWLETVYNELWR